MTIRDHFESYVDFKKKEDTAIQYIVNFITTNSDVMSSDGYTKRLVFGEQRRQDMLRIYGFDQTTYKSLCKTNAILMKNFTQMNEPLNSFLLLAYANSTSSKRRVFLDFLALKLYTSKIYRSFPNGVNVPRMQYVINHILTKKSFVVKYRSLGVIIQRVVDTFIGHFGDRLDRLTDADILDMINSMSTRVGLMVRKVAREYYESEARLHREKENRDRDNIQLTTNESQKIDSVINTVVQSHIRGGLDFQVLRISNATPYKDIFTDMVNKDNDKVTSITRGLMADCVRNGGHVSTIDIRTDIIGFSSKNRNPSYSSDIAYLCDKYEVKNRKEFEKALTRYLALKLYRCML
ncbi:MAG: hypothetical protein ACRCZ9_12130 [Fusobacteriaceae bacterium]